MIPTILTAEVKRSRVAVEYQENLDYRSGWPDKYDTEIAVDTETTGLNPREDRCVAVSMSQDIDEAWVSSAKVIQEISAPDLETVSAIGHNIQFDDPVLRGIGKKLNWTFDTMVAAYVLGRPRMGLKILSPRELGITMQGIDDLIQKGQFTMEDVPWDVLTHYAGADADLTLQLKHLFQAELDKEPKLQAIFDLEMAVMPMLIRMSDVGVSVDSDYLIPMGEKIEEELDVLKVKIKQYSKNPAFNPDSPAQLSKLLFTDLGIEPIRSTDTPGQFKTDKDTLQELGYEHPVVNDIVEYRRLGVLLRTFVRKLPGIVSEVSGRIHCSWNQIRVITGRLSSNDPNLQNIPVRGKIGDAVRAGFIPLPGNCYVGADFSGIEIRVIAHMTGDAQLCEMIAEGVDPHGWMANYMFDLGFKNNYKAQVPALLRDVAKTGFFCIVYRGSEYALSKLLRPVLSWSEASEMCERRNVKPGRNPYITLAKQVIKGTYDAYKGLRPWQDREIELSAQRGYTESLEGRRRSLVNLRAPSVKAREADERVACNHPIQATAGGDIMKRAMLAVWDEFKGYDWFWPVLQIHDELQIEVPIERGHMMKDALIEIMPSVLKLDVPLAVDAKVGKSWAETH